MYTGNMLDELMASVEQAEQSSYGSGEVRRPAANVKVHATYMYEFANEEMVEVA